MAGKLWILGHALSWGSRVGGLVTGSVVIVKVYLKGDTTDEALGALGTMMVV
jgi:hypothetical protein